MFAINIVGTEKKLSKSPRHSLPCSSSVTSLCCDGKFILCGLEEGLIEIFERIQFERYKRLDFHRKTVTALAINKVRKQWTSKEKP